MAGIIDKKAESLFRFFMSKTYGETIEGLWPDLYVPTAIYAQPDGISLLPSIVQLFGSRVLFITSTVDFNQYNHLFMSISRNLQSNNIPFIVYDEFPENNTDYIDSAVYFARKTHCNLIIGFGGIDSINAAKTVALLTPNYLFAHELFSYPHLYEPIPFISIPTHPLFGFEITPCTIISDIHDGIKKAFFHNYIFPKAIIIDPELSVGVEEDTIAKYTLGTLAIATESVISKNINNITNTLSLRTIDLVFKNLHVALQESDNETAKLNLLMASLMAGIAFSSAQLSVSLAISLALASLTQIDIASYMSVMLPHIMEYNLTSAPGKYVQMSKVMDEDVRDITVIEAAIKAVEGVRKLALDVDIPQRLSQFDVNKTIFSKVAEITLSYPFIQNAPRVLNRDEVETILIAAY